MTTALLYKMENVWILETRMNSTHHVARSFEFNTATAARIFAKNNKISVKRATGCDA